MSAAITASNDAISANTFGAVNPQPFEQNAARVVSAKDNQLTGFLSNEDRINISPQAQAKSQAEQQITEQQSKNNISSTEGESQEQPSDEFIQVSSSLGRASSTGNLKRDEAMAIYQKIASLI